MKTIVTSQKGNLLIITMLFFTALCFSQREVAKWKLQVGIGFNHAFPSGFSDNVYGEDINFPTVNVGLQHMFTQQLGAKLDIGYNRIKSGDNLPEFKTNYTRVNAQFVYDPSNSIGFLPTRMRTVFHAGPGIAFTKPLGDLGDNNLTFLNGILGGEIHYGISEKLSIYIDGSYLFGFSGEDLNELPNAGYGAFNGNMMTVTLGLSISLSGCYYCND